MIEVRYKFERDKRSRNITIIVIVVVGLALAYVGLKYAGIGVYPLAWSASLIAAVISLFVLSIPKYIRVTAEEIDIQCLVELTNIKMKNVSSIRKMEQHEMKYCFPVLGSYGFFGYYGYYFDLRRMRFVRVIASKWSNFVEITDVFEQYFIVSCDQADHLIERVDKFKKEAIVPKRMKHEYMD